MKIALSIFFTTCLFVSRVYAGNTDTDRCTQKRKSNSQKTYKAGLAKFILKGRESNNEMFKATVKLMIL
jgi:hypothetical protein